MTHDDKIRLAHTGDMGLAASAIRLRAARSMSGQGQKSLAAAMGVRNTALSNAENGLTYPSREVLRHYYREHRIDFNFLMNGDFSHLPLSVQEPLFSALEVANSEWDQKEGLSRPSDERQAKRPRTETAP